jgi:predicted enzyme related to lactoylglutathione lyase
LDQIVIDCESAERLARFWSAVLGGEAVDRGNGWWHVAPPGFPRLAFQPVPEGKSIKNRLHLDIEVDAMTEAIWRASAQGARQIGEVVRDESGAFQVMQDPEGNEFCFVHD